MKKMKKLFALLLAVVMVVGFAACSSNKGDDSKTEAPKNKGEISVFYYTFSDAYISTVRSSMDKSSTLTAGFPHLPCSSAIYASMVS